MKAGGTARSGLEYGPSCAKRARVFEFSVRSLPFMNAKLILLTAAVVAPAEPKQQDNATREAARLALTHPSLPKGIDFTDHIRSLGKNQVAAFVLLVPFCGEKG